MTGSGASATGGEPTTEAGRRFLRILTQSVDPYDAKAMILAIEAEARTRAEPPQKIPDWCALIGTFMGQPQYCGEPAASAWHQPGEWFKHEFVPLTLTPTRAEPPPLDVRPQVAWFAQIMEQVLRDNDHKGGWNDCDPDWLLMRLRQEVAELDSAMASGTVPHTGVDGRTGDMPADPIREAADVANFAMMIADILGPSEDKP